MSTSINSSSLLTNIDTAPGAIARGGASAVEAGAVAGGGTNSMEAGAKKDMVRFDAEEKE